MLDGWLPFQKDITKWTKNTHKCPKYRDDNMSYVSQGMMEIPTIDEKNSAKYPPAVLQKFS